MCICRWVRSRNCGCLVIWFCYQLIAKPDNKTATVLWPDPYPVDSQDSTDLRNGFIIMTSSNGNILHITGTLCKDVTSHQWNPLTKAMMRSFDTLFDLHLNKRLSKQSRHQWFEMPSHPLWHHCNDAQQAMSHYSSQWWVSYISSPCWLPFPITRMHWQCYTTCVLLNK